MSDGGQGDVEEQGAGHAWRAGCGGGIWRYLGPRGYCCLALLAAALCLVACDPVKPQALLQIQAVGFEQGYEPRAGACARLRIAVRNIGDAVVSDITSVRIIVHPQDNPFHTVFDRQLFLPAMLPGSLQTRHQDAVRFPDTGVYTLHVVLDPERKLQQSQREVAVWRADFRVGETCEQRAARIR